MHNEQPIHDMISKAGTRTSPWVWVAGEDKKSGRIQILQTLCNGIQQALS